MDVGGGMTERAGSKFFTQIVEEKIKCVTYMKTANHFIQIWIGMGMNCKNAVCQFVRNHELNHKDSFVN